MARSTRWLLGRDEPVDLMHFVAVVAAFAVADVMIRSVARIDVEQMRGSVLILGAVRSNPLPTAILVLALAAGLRFRRDRLLAPWHELEHGRALRLLMAPVLVVLAWQGALYEYNFLLDRTHGVDRWLIVLFAAGCVARPMFCIPFALQYRVIAAQLEHPFGTTVVQNIDDLLTLALVAVGAIHVWFVLTGRRDTSPAIALVVAAIATHFFIPGRSKVVIGWLTTTDISNLPLSSYTAGWRGQGDGAWSRTMADLARSAGLLGLLATLMLELSAAIAVIHHRVFRVWLVGCIFFHVSVFAVTGYWFFSWIVLEVALIVLLTRPGLQRWVSRNNSPARAVLTVGLVAVLGPTLFHPPGLGWLDSPISYGYRVEAVTEDGERVSVPLSEFAPYEQELAFYRTQLGERQPLSGSYGAIIGATLYRQLDSLESFSDVEALELPTEDERRQQGEAFILRFVEDANERERPWWAALAPPDHFWTGSPEPRWEGNDRIQQLDVFVLTALHADGSPRFRTELALTVVVDDDGRARVITPSSE